MKRLLYTTLIVFSLVLMACPYEGTVELTTYEDALKFDKVFLGEWVAYNQEGGKDELVIEKGNKNVLFVSHKFYEKNKLNQRTKYRAYATEVGSVALFTLESDDNKYKYCKYEITGKNEFNVQFIDADYMEVNFNPEEEVTTKVLKEFLTEHINDEGIFTEKMEYYRKHSPEYEKVRRYMQQNGFK